MNNLKRSYDICNIEEKGVDEKSFALGAKHVSTMIKKAIGIGISKVSLGELLNELLEEAEELL